MFSMFRQGRLCAAGTAFGLLLACAGQANAAPVQAGFGPRSRIAALFTPATLGGTVSALERVAGRATQSTARVRDYRVDGCSVQALVVDGKVGALAMETSPSCTFDIDPFFDGISVGTANSLIFGRVFDRFTDGVLTADCLRMCGNAVEPSLHYTAGDGRRALTIETVLVEEADAADQWESTMRAGRGDDWVVDAKFNCDHTFDDVGKSAFHNAKVRRVVIWASPPAFDCDAPRPI